MGDKTVWALSDTFSVVRTENGEAKEENEKAKNKGKTAEKAGKGKKQTSKKKASSSTAKKKAKSSSSSESDEEGHQLKRQAALAIALSSLQVKKNFLISLTLQELLELAKDNKDKEEDDVINIDTFDALGAEDLLTSIRDTMQILLKK